MRRGFLLLGAWAIILAACGGGDVAQGGFVADNTPVDLSVTPEQIDGTWYVPDFEFILGDGSTFASADADIPIFLMFWAEW